MNIFKSFDQKAPTCIFKALKIHYRQLLACSEEVSTPGVQKPMGIKFLSSNRDTDT